MFKNGLILYVNLLTILLSPIIKMLHHHLFQNKFCLNLMILKVYIIHIKLDSINEYVNQQLIWIDWYVNLYARFFRFIFALILISLVLNDLFQPLIYFILLMLPILLKFLLLQFSAFLIHIPLFLAILETYDRKSLSNN